MCCGSGSLWCGSRVLFSLWCGSGIRIQLFTLMQMQIRLFTLMQIRIRILLLIKMMLPATTDLLTLHGFICRPSNSTVSEIVGFEPRAVATFALAVYALSHKVNIPIIPQCLSLRWNWDLPNSSPSSECALPLNQRGAGAHTRLRVRG